MRAIETKWDEQKVEKVNGVPIKWGKDIDGRPIVQRFAFSSQHSAVLHEFIQDPRFTSLYPLLGPHAKNPRMGENEKDGLVINHYINIDSSNFSRLGWHTDSLRDVFYGKRITEQGLSIMSIIGVVPSATHTRKFDEKVAICT